MAAYSHDVLEFSRERGRGACCTEVTEEEDWQESSKTEILPDSKGQVGQAGENRAEPTVIWKS
jgi:hypothetical protein